MLELSHIRFRRQSASAVGAFVSKACLCRAAPFHRLIALRFLHTYVCTYVLARKFETSASFKASRVNNAWGKSQLWYKLPAWAFGDVFLDEVTSDEKASRDIFGNSLAIVYNFVYDVVCNCAISFYTTLIFKRNGIETRIKIQLYVHIVIINNKINKRYL